jgi:Ca2+-binding RTX toxin-like protein
MIEKLEPRRLFAATWFNVNAEGLVLFNAVGTAELTSKGTLVLKGSAAADHIVVTRKGNRISATFWGNPVGESFSAGDVKRVLVEAGDGFDKVYIDPALNERVTVQGGMGGDILIGNAGATLIGGGGNDKLQIQPPSPFVLNYTVNRPVGLRIETRSGARATFDGDPFVITPGTTVWTVTGAGGLLSGGAGNDTLLPAQAGDSVVGGAGTDRVILIKGVTLTYGEKLEVEGLAELSGVEVISSQFVAAAGG